MPSSSSIRLPQIKICGVTRVQDLDVLANAGVDSVGFNFVPASPRSINVQRADELCERAAALGLVRVAVVMDLAPQEIVELLARIDVDFLQLHGKEPPEILAACNGVGVIKAVSWNGREDEEQLATAWGNTFRESSVADGSAGSAPSALRAFLVDAYAPGQGGGSGRVARWDLLFPRPNVLESVPLILAGGLTSKNVREAIETTHPDGVDAASGVEESPGIKSADKVTSFANNATAAFSQ